MVPWSHQSGIGKLLIAFLAMATFESDKTVPISKPIPGPPNLRHYPACQLVAWRPEGILDDGLLDNIAEWLFAIEKASLPFKRFVDFSGLTVVSIRTRHLFEFARKRAEQFAGIAPVRTALYCDDWVGFGIAKLYESLMENTPIEARVFQRLPSAAEWLDVPLSVLQQGDSPVAGS